MSILTCDSDSSLSDSSSVWVSVSGRWEWCEWECGIWQTPCSKSPRTTLKATANAATIIIMSPSTSNSLVRIRWIAKYSKTPVTYLKKYNIIQVAVFPRFLRYFSNMCTINFGLCQPTLKFIYFEKDHLVFKVKTKLNLKHEILIITDSTERHD